MTRGGAAVRPGIDDTDDAAADDGADLTRPADGAAPVAPGQLVAVRNRPWVVTEVTRSTLTTDDPARSAEHHHVTVLHADDDFAAITKVRPDIPMIRGEARSNCPRDTTAPRAR
ncbi:hypothetical protein [Streptomyces sp. P9-A2]|uniref:hypothetical protein n=1 Tax=Streptomyces sp. P9-A2 TaxID=3072284 RepID=UPI002FC8A255